MQGWRWTAFIHPDDVGKIVEKWRLSLATGEPFLQEARVLRADGEYRWMGDEITLDEVERIGI